MIGKIFEMLERSKIDPWNPGEIQDFPTIFRQTGYRRSGPVAICQDIEYLLKVHIFNYDQTVEEFQKYCASRGIYCSENEPTTEGMAEHLHAAKIQDCWELWLRRIGALHAEEYSDQPFTKYDLLRRLLKTIYRRD